MNFRGVFSGILCLVIAAVIDGAHVPRIVLLLALGWRLPGRHCHSLEISVHKRIIKKGNVWVHVLRIVDIGSRHHRLVVKVTMVEGLLVSSLVHALIMRIPV